MSPHREWSASESRVSTSYPSRNHGWPSVKEGVEVTIEICSDAMESALYLLVAHNHRLPFSP
jgi:hypothetical protein